MSELLRGRRKNAAYNLLMARQYLRLAKEFNSLDYAELSVASMKRYAVWKAKAVKAQIEEATKMFDDFFEPECDVCGTKGLKGEVEEAYEDGPLMCAECFEAHEYEINHGWKSA